MAWEYLPFSLQACCRAFGTAESLGLAADAVWKVLERKKKDSELYLLDHINHSRSIYVLCFRT